jgi:dihydroneopterin aldolase
MDRIEIRGVEAYGRHGALPAERRDGQRFLVDVVLELDTAPAAAANDLSLSVDYADMAQRVHDVVAGEPVDLLETLAQRLADVCLSEAAVAGVRVTVHKPDAPLAVAFSDVAVTIERSRR